MATSLDDPVLIDKPRPHATVPGKHGIHRYAPEEFGVDPDRVRSEFGDYINHFGLEPEDAS
jgi:hypothetical protein